MLMPTNLGKVSKQSDVRPYIVIKISYKWRTFHTAGKLPRPARPTKFGSRADQMMLKKVSRSPSLLQVICRQLVIQSVLKCMSQPLETDLTNIGHTQSEE